MSEPVHAPLLSADDALRITAALQKAALEPDGWVRILTLLAQCTGTTKAALVNVDAIHPSQSQSYIVGLDPELTARFQNRSLEKDILFQALRRLPVGAVALGSELLTEEQMRAGRLWTELAVPAGIEYRLCAVLDNRPEEYTVFALLRSERDFTQPEKDFLRGLVPHLQAVMTISRSLQRAEAGRREVIRMFDYARQPVAILDRSGYAIYVNAIAATVLEAADGLSLRLGRFLFGSVATQMKFETAVRRALDRNASAPEAPPRTDIRVERSGGRPPLEVVVIAVRRPSDRALLPEDTGCMVLLIDPTLPQVVVPGRLMRLYGLTAAEAKVCEALLATGSANEVAELLHITGNTARTHLKSIFEKVGVANQAQLMQRLTLLGRPATPADIVGFGIATGP